MTELPAWAPRVERWKIRRLYESEAAGRLDEDLLEDIGVSLWARCQSIMDATRLHRGELECPRCATTIRDEGRIRFRPRERGAATCPSCGWSTPWAELLDSIKGRELVAGAAEPYFRRYLDAYPGAAGSSRQKMLLIDALLHEFHSSARFGDIRPAAVNVIGGRLRDVMALLDELAGFGSTPGQLSWRTRAPDSVFGRHLAARASTKGD